MPNARVHPAASDHIAMAVCLDMTAYCISDLGHSGRKQASTNSSDGQPAANIFLVQLLATWSENAGIVRVSQIIDGVVCRWVAIGRRP